MCRLALAFAILCLAASVVAADRPNVVVILADDLGYADVGAQGQAEDVRTPHLDRLAREGVRCRAGYVTAPQCSPSRAGLITGRYQQRFGLDTIPDCPLPLEEVTLAERLTAGGYACGMVGKWHLEPNAQSRKWVRENLSDAKPSRNGRTPIPFERAAAYYPGEQGFDEFFVGTWQRYHANFVLAGNDLKPDGETVEDTRFRVDVQTDAAIAFLERNHERPFFLYLAYYAPHVPLEATQEYLDLFPGEMPERRRYALAMTAAMDGGVGRILDLLEAKGLGEETLIVFTSDNGAPLKLEKKDTPIDVPGAEWNGSLNDPWVGEKGMLAEGGIRVPFLLRWKGTLPAGEVYDRPVSTLDIAATAVAAAGLPRDEALDGVDLVPFLTGMRDGDPHEALYWRFWNQAAVRAGDWKYLVAGDREEYLFDLDSEAHETRNVIAEQPERAARLRERLREWTQGLQPAGVSETPLNGQEENWYRFYFGLPETGRLRKNGEAIKRGGGAS